MQADEVSVMAKVTPQKESGWRKQHQQKADSAQASRRWLATQLAALVAFSGMIPIAVVGVISLRTLRVRAIADAQGTLQAVAQQAAERIRTYEIQQREMLHAIAANMGTDAQAEQRLEEITLDARSFKVLRLLDNKSHHDKFFQHIPATLLMQAFAGAEISSEIYAAADSTPAIDSCVPVRARPGHTVCASLDLFELQRLVQRIHVGESGEAVALNPEGHVLDRAGRVADARLPLLAAGARVVGSGRAVAHGGPNRGGHLARPRASAGDPQADRFACGDGRGRLPAGDPRQPEVRDLDAAPLRHRLRRSFARGEADRVCHPRAERVRRERAQERAAVCRSARRHAQRRGARGVAVGARRSISARARDAEPAHQRPRGLAERVHRDPPRARRGPGISPDRVPEIFSAFLSTKRTGAHVGLGLANVHRIVRAHGGIASLRSQLGRGSTFIITLPLATKPD